MNISAPCGLNKWSSHFTDWKLSAKCYLWEEIARRGGKYPSVHILGHGSTNIHVENHKHKEQRTCLLEQRALTWEAAHKNRVVGISWCRCWVWALGIHLVSIHHKLKAVFDLLGSDSVPLSITHMAWDPGIVDRRESASTIIHVEHKLGSRKMSRHRWLQ